MGRKQLESDNGSALVLTLLVLLVLSVLGTSLGVVTIGSHRLSRVNQNDNSAYYIAEAGAQRAYERLQRDVLAAYDDSHSPIEFDNKLSGIIENINKTVYSDFALQKGIQPNASIKIVDRKIYSTGVIGNQERTVEKDFSVEWQDKGTGGGLPIVPVGASILAKESLTVKGGATIQSDAYLDSVKENSFIINNAGKLNGTLYHNERVTKSKLVDASQGLYNSVKTVSSVLEIPWNEYENYTNKPVEYVQNTIISRVESEKVTRDELNNKHFKDFQLPNNFVIDTQDKDVNFSVDNFYTYGGKLTIIGKGKVSIYVNTNLILSGGVLNSNQETNSLNFYYLGKGNWGSNPVVIENNLSFNGNIFLENKALSKLIITGPDVKGMFVSKKANIEVGWGGVKEILVIAPNSEVEILGGSQSKGIIVAKSVILSNGARFSYHLSTEFPFSSSNSESITKPEDVITSTPILETK